ncbi:hypothetical protein UL82_10110 [Corynebacterium kutscheri]|uniref:Uncharacterized protein n=1 Tax=Corynebacterium kutscheri TaxID=35755 RepID=A0A0F6TEH4_9CORY|nr:hypothetical protein [Corynebacterium kutscheri]AKE42159.1 hypothetical protein UL82_10110 [Corynebacterium kutscheri]VEH10502.1 Uncharacterised protein [Corynebacterium kutscheri]
MVRQKREQLSRPQIISASATLLATGVTWTVVILYRMNVKSIDGEWGNVVLASLGLGFVFLPYVPASSSRGD